MKGKVSHDVFEQPFYKQGDSGINKESVCVLDAILPTIEKCT